jgi:iron(III) transport system substrate-binding protein
MAAPPNWRSCCRKRATLARRSVLGAGRAAALGAVVELFAELPEETAGQGARRSTATAEGRWVGTSGRGRVLAYSTERVAQDELPATMADLTDERFRGRMALAPTNGSFIAHVAGAARDRGR